MPLNDDTILKTDYSYSDLHYEKITELRSSIIGNKDIKYKLIGDVQFIRLLVKSFTLHVQEINEKLFTFSRQDAIDKLDFLEREVVVLKILCGFIPEVNSHKQTDIKVSLNSFEQLTQPILIFISFFIENISSLILSAGDVERAKRVESIVGYCLDICLNLSNNKRDSSIFDSDESNRLWKFVVSLLIISNDHSKVDAILTRSLRLVPLILQITKVRDSFIITLLSSILKRLSKECKIICCIYFSDSGDSFEYLNKLAFENTSLPNVEPNVNIFKSKINISLLTNLITCTAQVFGFSKENDYEIFMAHPLGNSSRDSSVVVLSVKIYMSLLLLLKFPNKALNLSTLNLIGFYLNNLRPSADGYGIDNNLIFNNYKKLFPVLIEMLELNDIKIKASSPPIYLLSPIKILANLCTQYSYFNDEIRRANLDLEILRILDKNFKSCQQLKTLTSLSKSLQNSKKLVDFTILLATSQDDQFISDLLLLLSIYTSTNEEYRYRITNQGDFKSIGNDSLSEIIFEIIDIYRFLLNQVQLFYQVANPRDISMCISKEDIPWYNKNLGILLSLIHSSIFTNCLYLIRSLSRSVSTLRTFFVECNSMQGLSGSSMNSKSKSGSFIQNFLMNLQGIESTGAIIDFFYSFNKANDFSKKTRMVNKSIALGTLANFVLDFSSFRYEIVNESGFLKNLSAIYHNASDQMNENASNCENSYQRNMVQLNVLQVLKNFMFNENNETKSELIESFPLKLIFEKASFGLIPKSHTADIRNIKQQQKLVAFDILRNFTAGSPNFNEILIKSYEGEFCKQNPVPEKWSTFLIKNITEFELFTENSQQGSFDDDEFLLTMILNDNYLKLVTAINYIEDHKYTNIESIEERAFPKDELLNTWMRFLSLTIPSDFESKLEMHQKIALNSNLNEIKISIVWILINLTWKSDTFGYHLREYNNFNLFETVDERTKRISTSRIDIDDSDDSDTSPNKEIHSNTKNRATLTALDRAQYLKNFGFSNVLSTLINHFSKSNSTSSRVGFNDRRFDWENSNDLFEKIMTASHQISGLINRNRGSFSLHNADRQNPRSGSRLLAISERDVNRGGEGYGYESDNDFTNSSSQPRNAGTRNSEIQQEQPEGDEFDNDYWTH